jgi:hypothetical protein
MWNDDTVVISDSAVIINASHFINHDGYTQHLHGLIRMLHDIADELIEKKLVFRFHDGEPIKLVAFDKIVSEIVDTLGLDQTKIVFELLDHVPKIDTQFKIKLRHTPLFDLAKDLVKSDMCVLNQNYLMFGAFFGRFTLHRMLMAYYLETQAAEHSLVVFQPEYKWAEFLLGPLKKHFSKQLEWLQSRREVNATLNHTANGCVGALECLPVYHEIFGLYAIEVVIETNVYEIGFFTEKTTKCLAAGKPFLLFGTTGQLQKLRDMGFKTFNGIIDESYDLEPNVEKRFDMICAEIDRIAKLSSIEKTSLVSELYKIALYNKNNHKILTYKYNGSMLS